MKIYLFLILLYCSTPDLACAQVIAAPAETQALPQLAGVGVSFPVGRFASSHSIGLTVGYSRSQNRFGGSGKPKGIAGWVLDGGLNYYVGKEVKEPAYDFRYGGYLNLFASGGIMVNPLARGNITLTAGPSMDIYKQGLNAGVRVNMSVRYFVVPTLAIGAGITWLKHVGSESLVAPGLNVAYAF